MFLASSEPPGRSRGSSATRSTRPNRSFTRRACRADGGEPGSFRHGRPSPRASGRLDGAGTCEEDPVVLCGVHGRAAKRSRVPWRRRSNQRADDRLAAKGGDRPCERPFAPPPGSRAPGGPPAVTAIRPRPAAQASSDEVEEDLGFGPPTRRAPPCSMHRRAAPSRHPRIRSVANSGFISRKTLP